MQILTAGHAKKHVAKNSSQFASGNVDLSALVNGLKRIAQSRTQALTELTLHAVGGSKQAMGIRPGRAAIPCFALQAGRPNLRSLFAAQQTYDEPIKEII